MSGEPRQYHDASGNPCSLGRLVAKEPDWAVNQIHHRDRLERENADLRDALTRLTDAVTHRMSADDATVSIVMELYYAHTAASAVLESKSTT